MSRGFDLDTVQAALVEAGVDGWLFAQFHGRDPLADRVLDRPLGTMQTRRWVYFIPAAGEPRGLVHAIEPAALDGMPGRMGRYRTWEEFESGVVSLLDGAQRVAMQYSPRNRLPYVATVDAGTVELVRDGGVEVVSSADLVQRFTAVLGDAQVASHRRAAEVLPRVVFEAFREVRRKLLDSEPLDEYGLQRFIVKRLEEEGLSVEDPPIVGVNEHAADPHYVPTARDCLPIREGDWLLVDVWAKLPEPRSVFADITWTAQVGDSLPERRAEVLDVVLRARDAAVDLIVERYEAGEPVAGFEADRAARAVIEKAGYLDHVQHRTGHSITDEIHGTGANLDDFESHDTRQLLRRTCFSVEPAIYLDDFGVRSEVDVLIPRQGAPEVTGVRQRGPVLLLGEDEPRLP